MTDLEAAVGLHVLVAEDDTEAPEMLVLILRSAGHRPTQASDSPTALRLVATGAFDAAVIDMSPPDLGGVQMVAEPRRRGIATPAHPAGPARRIRLANERACPTNVCQSLLNIGVANRGRREVW